MTDSKMDPQHGNDITRRTALQKIATGVGVVAGISLLPERWTSPIIGRVVLPAHAATSGSTLHDPCQVELRQGDGASGLVVIKVTGFVTPPTGSLPVKVVATAVGGANQQLTANSTTTTAGTFEVFMTIGGGPGITSVNVQTTVTGADGTASCSVNLTTPAPSCSLSSLTLEFRNFSYTTSWPGGTGPHNILVDGTSICRRLVFAPDTAAAAVLLGVAVSGVEYFSSDVTITPEPVNCFLYGAPCIAS